MNGPDQGTNLKEIALKVPQQEIRKYETGLKLLRWLCDVKLWTILVLLKLFYHLY